MLKLFDQTSSGQRYGEAAIQARAIFRTASKKLNDNGKLYFVEWKELLESIHKMAHSFAEIRLHPDTWNKAILYQEEVRTAIDMGMTTVLNAEFLIAEGHKEPVKEQAVLRYCAELLDVADQITRVI